MTPGELVLEPSAGTGLLAIHAEIAGAELALNELAETRHELLSRLFPQTTVTRFNAEQIDDYLDAAVQPATVLMNPPFSASPGIERSMRDATVRHIRSALRRLPDGGRLVVLTALSHDPANAEIKALYADLSDRASFVFTATVDGRIYARHGTTIDTRLTVIDRIPERARRRPCPGHARSQSRGTARADRGKTSAPAAILFPSGPSEDRRAIRPRHGSWAARISPFPPSGLPAGFAGGGRSSLRTARRGSGGKIQRAAVRTL